MIDARAILVAAALMGATSAQAQTYHLIAKVDSGVAFIDAESVKHAGATVRLWSTYFLFADGDGQTISRGTAFIMTHDEVDCVADRSRHLQLQSYDARGNPTDDVQASTPWVDIIPGSNDALEAKFACDGAFLKADTPFPSEAQMLATIRRARASFK
jgi:hypothetical protein